MKFITILLNIGLFFVYYSILYVIILGVGVFITGQMDEPLGLAFISLVITPLILLIFTKRLYYLR
jgi:hypothetical protein